MARTEEITVDPFSKTDYSAFQVQEIPMADENCLRYLGEAQAYLYQHPKHSLRDVLRPGYFDRLFARRGPAYLGALLIITICDGERDPAKWSTMLARVVQVSGARGIDADEHCLIGIIARWGRPTVAAHAGEPVEDLDDEDAAEAA